MPKPDALDNHRQHVAASLQYEEYLRLAAERLLERDLIAFYTAKHAARLCMEAMRCLEPGRQEEI